uniref:Uncharacterized protein n=1 Tax=Panagrolaimus sp. PS1159 TaxID=55785 RepID=A0AC35G3E9_9BILA
MKRDKILNDLKKEAREHQKRLKREAKERRERRRQDEMERERVELVKKAEIERLRAERIQERIEKVFKEQEARAKKELEIAEIREELTKRSGSITSVKSLTIAGEELELLSERAQSMTPNIPEIIPLTKENLQIHNERTSNVDAEKTNATQLQNHVQNISEEHQIVNDVSNNETVEDKCETEAVKISEPNQTKAANEIVMIKKSSKYVKKGGRKRNASTPNIKETARIVDSEPNKARSEEAVARKRLSTKKSAADSGNAGAVAATKSLDSGSSNSPELGKDFGTFVAETQRRSNELYVVLEYAEQMAEVPLIVQRPLPVNMDDIEEPPSPIMEEEAQFTGEDLPLVEASIAVTNSHETNEIDANTTMSTTSSKGLRGHGKRMGKRYDKKVKWSRKKNTKATPTLPPPPSSETSQQPPKKPRKPRQKHKWRQTPSRTPSPPPPSPPLPPKRRRAQAVPLQIDYQSPKKRKQAENQENDNTGSQPLQPPTLRQSTNGERTVSVEHGWTAATGVSTKTSRPRKNIALPPEKPPALKSVSSTKSTNSSAPPPPKRVGRPRKLVETTNDQPSTSSTSTKPLGKRIIKKRVSLSPEPIPIKRKTQKK